MTDISIILCKYLLYCYKDLTDLYTPATLLATPVQLLGNTNC